VPAVRAGVGLNFGIPLGMVCGLFGTVVVMNGHGEGFGGLLAAMAIGGVVGAVAGILFARLLEAVRGQEMMVGMYVGFGAVAGASILWALAPVKNPELIFAIGGRGVRQTLLLEGYFKGVLDRFGAFPLGQGTVPTGLLLFWLLTCGLMALFLRTRTGLALTAAGANPRFAEASGINVRSMRTLGIAISTALAGVGIVVFSQSYGFVQLYKAPLLMAFPTVAAILIGGASVRQAKISHVIIGTFLFQSVLTTSLPLVNDLVQGRGSAQALGNIPEIARLVISNGIILYALTRRER
ncbi:MAG: ABC transporter permease, partial [Candidatus Eisenbacteria bacterium]|nr:ABC transporter permease [Candidatus Eisenbacteria bacterium]